MSDICEVCGLPKELCVCEELVREQQKITIKLDRRRYGKMMTLIEGLNPNEVDLHSLVSKLKSACACGGTVKDGIIELQGDHRVKAKEILEKMGFRVESLE
ncbi:MAG: stress response translation initiation inhibitor YciH [Thermoplasmata archaeon]|nr:stress response translation initiation inhibitor YciH [Thermoplasmata archaeon]